MIKKSTNYFSTPENYRAAMVDRIKKAEKRDNGKVEKMNKRPNKMAKKRKTVGIWLSDTSGN